MLLLDTSFLIAAVVANDAHHARALPLMHRIRNGEWKHVVLTDQVFLEAMNVLTKRVGEVKAATIGEAWLTAPETTLMLASSDFEVNWRMFRSAPAPGMGFTDATLVRVAREYGIRDIATFDDAFTKIQGVRVLPGVPGTPG